MAAENGPCVRRVIPADEIAPRRNSDSNHSSMSSGIIIGATRMKFTNPRLPCLKIGLVSDRNESASSNPILGKDEE